MHVHGQQLLVTPPLLPLPLSPLPPPPLLPVLPPVLPASQ
jgi:hypothetical protein